MNKTRQSIRWRIVLICFLLVFIAMSIVSVYLMGRIENYQLSSLQQNIDSTVSESNLLETLGRYENLTDNESEIESYISEGFSWGNSQEISVVSPGLEIIASTNPSLQGRRASAVFDAGLITRVL
ncbi:MAG: hypothetical protein IKZ78_04120, partial [Firmicutes bacterium]|nr:hypothetical protein [Bacillota bacterium]